MSMETVTIAISLTNLVVLLGLVFKVGGVYERFLLMEKSMCSFPAMQLMVRRLADKVGLTHSEEFGGGD